MELAPDQQEQAAREGRGQPAVAGSALPTCASPHSNAKSHLNPPDRPHVITHVAIALNGATRGFAPDLGELYA